ncbi:MAG: aminotransferase class III-fold pyridoxal phosphate-dependent enzyme [Actinobacteria bacterium]|nr:aminotransferase class III-fold pyridoxal phosphate-dependent enzyme [Actinomycetota bacterium]
MAEDALSVIQREYTKLTPGSARLMARAAQSMPRGLTRTLSWFDPYPVVFDRGRGANVYDVDGRRYVDHFNNGLSLMHGHAYPPIEEALLKALPRGTAWPGTSEAQIEFAEMLCERIRGDVQVRFANTGTEAMMVAVKLARHVTGRPVLIKAWHAYHGSFDDLEVGLQDRGEVPGRVALADFGDLASYERALEQNRGQVAAIVVEPVQYTGIVTAPPEGFLPRLRRLAAEAGVLFVLDDCLMFRLAEGGSAERFDFEADITCLGKWIGGGLPVGAIAAPPAMMDYFDLHPEQPLYHGGSFNGNLLGMIAGAIAVRDFTDAAAARISGQAERLKAEIASAAEEVGVPVSTPGFDSVFGLYVLDGADGEIDWKATSLLQLAAVTRGIYYGSGGEFGLSTALTDDDLEHTISGLREALGDVALELQTVS